MQAGVKERYDSFIANMIINGMNGALAVRQTTGYSDKYAHTTARHLSTIPYIKEALAKKQAELAKKHDITADNVVKELAKIGFSNIEDYLTVDEDGQTHLKNFDDIERNLLSAVESIKVSTVTNKDDSREYTTTQFKLHSKLNALEQLGKHLGIYERDNEQKAVNLIDILAIVGITNAG